MRWRAQCRWCLPAALALVACSDDGDTHAPLPVADKYVLAALNEAHTGNLGGLSGADALCVQQAAAAGHKETFQAFLSNKYFQVMDLVPPEAAETIPIVNTQGEELAPSWTVLLENGRWTTGADLYSFDGKRVDENAGAEPNWVDADGWHGSLVGGEINIGNTCLGWTSSKETDTGAAGELDMRRLLGQETHSCDTTLAVVCLGALVLPSYGPCQTPGAPCTAGDPCAIDPICGPDKQCRPSGFMSCADQLECTEDICDGHGGCEHTIKPDACLIGSQCYTQGEVDDSGCASCQPDKSQEDWTALGTVCIQGGNCYQKGEYGPTGCEVCEPAQGTDGWVPRTDSHCKIGGQCYSPGEKHPDGCAECDPATSSISWTPKGNDCFIDGQCYAPGVKDPSGCNTCDPTRSKTTWSSVLGMICKIGGQCYQPGDKHPDGCAECDPSVTGLAWTPKGTDCFIASKCYPPGTKDPSGCNSCQPSVAKADWSPITTPLCTIGLQCYVKGDKHPQGCAECDPSASTTGWTVVTNDCLIDDQCYQSGATKPTGCGQCTPFLSKTSWSPLAGCFEIVLVALNQAHTGNMGGLAGADALCASQASTAGLPGTFKAFLSGATRDVKDLVTGTAASNPVTNNKGEVLFSSWGAVFTTSSLPGGTYIYSFDGKKVDEGTGASPDWYDAQNWTGTQAGGTLNASANCQSWTSAASSDTGSSGELDMAKLVYGYTQPCYRTLAVVCAKTAP